MNNNMNPLNLLAFLKVSELGSFTAAAKHLGISKAHASQQVSELEKTLHAKLLHRTTRSLSLTESGRLLKLHAQNIENELVSAEASVKSLSGEVSGTLKIVAPNTTSRHFLAPYIHLFLKNHPNLTLDLEVTNRPVDIIEEGVDILFKIGLPTQTTYIVKEIGRPKLLLCGHKSLVRKLKIRSTAQLGKVPFVGIKYNQRHPTVRLEKGGKTEEIKISVKAFSNDPQVIYQFVCNQMGIGIVPSFLARERIEAGELVQVLPEWTVPSEQPLYAIYPSRNSINPKVRIFVSWLVQQLKKRRVFV